MATHKLPLVLEVAAAVDDTISALNLLDMQQAGPEINRALVLPITIAGCHCESPSQREFFRSRFNRLGPEAKAFGNSSQALALMEEVWRKRDLNKAGPSTEVDWRGTMRELGWAAGILLI